MAQMHSCTLLVRATRTFAGESTHAKAAPEPLDDALLDAPVPPALAEDHILVLDESGVLALDQHLLRLLPAEKRDFFGELCKTRVRVT